ncbi:MAG: DNA-processing protein DprA [bacterium]|nr:DNA-processing protein DprA [bacterium]
MTEAALYLSLLRLPGIGSAALRSLLKTLADKGIPPEDVFKLDEQTLLSEIKLLPEQVAALRNPITDAEEDLIECRKLGIEILLHTDLQFPHRIWSYMGRSAPMMLFVRGNPELLLKPGLGISGARAAGDGSLSDLTEICTTASADGWVIVSGGARGVDEVAHLAALRQGPGTIVVLPTGLLKPNYRVEFSRYLEGSKSLLISEFPPERTWTPGCAMQRNRLLAALSRAVILVDPGPKSGTLGTGRATLRMRIPVFIMENSNGNPEIISDLYARGAMRVSPKGWKPGELTRFIQINSEEFEISRSRSNSQTRLAL